MAIAIAAIAITIAAIAIAISAIAICAIANRKSQCLQTHRERTPWTLTL